MKGAISVHVEDLCVGYGGPDVLRDAQLTVSPNAFHVLLGESGCGKTTLLRAIAGFEDARQGHIRLGDVVVDDAAVPTRRVPPERRGIGIVFQDYALFPHLTVLANVAFGAGRGAAAQQRAHAALEQVGLEAAVACMPDELSGGQQQRVALARALASEPRLLLLDEPFSNLDPGRRAELRRSTREIVRERAVTALMVTHDAAEALELADTLSVMAGGRILQTGTPGALYAAPVCVAVARALGEVQLLPAQANLDGATATCALGTVALAIATPATGTHVLARPEMIALTDSGSGAAATIRERRFLGADVAVLVELDSGEALVARVRPWELPERSDVRVQLRGPTVLLSP